MAEQIIQNTEVLADTADAGTQEATENTQEQKTFTQEEVDAIIKKRIAKLEKQMLKQGAEPQTENQETANIVEAVKRAVTAEIKAELLIGGFDPAKVGRALRLVDIDGVTDKSGQIDVELLQSELTALKKEFPELLAIKTEKPAKIEQIGKTEDEQKRQTKQVKRFF